jgi:hypothetical protein
VEEEATGGCLGINPVGQASEMDIAFFETIDQIHEAFDTPPKPIQFPDDQCVAGAQVREGIVQTGPSQASPAGFVREDTIAAGLFEGVELQGYCREGFRCRVETC